MSHALGREVQVFVKAESSFATPVLPTATDALRHDEANVTSETERLENKARHAGRSAQLPIENKRSGEFSFKYGLIPSGNPGTAPEQHVFFDSVFTKTEYSTTSAIEASPAPTVNGCTLTTPAAVSAGDLIAVPVAGIYHVVYVMTKETAAITWTPALPAAPAAGDTIGARIVYTPKDKPTGSFTMMVNRGDAKVDTACGCIPNVFEIDFAGGDYAQLSVSGPCADVAEIGEMELTDDIDDDDTEIPVDWVNGFVASASKARAWGLIGEEIVKMSAVDYEDSNITVARAQGGTSAVAHVNESGTYPTIYPYAPDPTYGTQEPIAGILGKVYVNGAVFHVKSAKFTDNENLKPLTEIFGQVHAEGYVAPANREVTVTLDGYLKNDETPWAFASNFDPPPVILQSGTKAGEIVALWIPKLLIDIPKIEDTADAEISLTISGKAIQYAAANDEFAIMFA